MIETETEQDKQVQPDDLERRILSLRATGARVGEMIAKISANRPSRTGHDAAMAAVQVEGYLDQLGYAHAQFTRALHDLESLLERGDDTR